MSEYYDDHELLSSVRRVSKRAIKPAPQPPPQGSAALAKLRDLAARQEAIEADLRRNLEQQAAVCDEAERLAGIDLERSGRWVCGDGRTLRVAEMTDEHLGNAIRWVQRHIDSAVIRQRQRAEALARLCGEAHLRGIGNKS